MTWVRFVAPEALTEKNYTFETRDAIALAERCDAGKSGGLIVVRDSEDEGKYADS